MATQTISYAATATVFAATDLDSLAASSTWLAGRESSVIDNTTNKYVDAFLSGRFKANNTAPTAGQIQIWIGAVLNDTPEYPDVFDGTGSAETVNSAGIRNSIMYLAHVIDTDTTSNRIYEMRPTGVAQFFGGIMPNKWFVFVTHSMVQALNTTANNGGQMWYTGVKYDIS